VGHQICNDNKALATTLNYRFPGELAELTGKINARLVHFSTYAVFSGHEFHHPPYMETDETEPFSTYGETKLLGEQHLLENCELVTVLRSNFFGWSKGGDRGVLDYFVKRLSLGKPVIGFNRYLVTSAYAGDIAKSLVQILDKERNGLFHLTSQDSMSKYDFGVMVANQFGFDPTLIQPRDPTAWKAEKIQHRDLSLSNVKLASHGVAVPVQSAGISRAMIDLSDAFRQSVPNASEGSGSWPGSE